MTRSLSLSELKCLRILDVATSEELRMGKMYEEKVASL